MRFVSVSKTEHWSEHCSHEHQGVRRFYARDWVRDPAGRTRQLKCSYRYQCLHCGGYVRAVKKAEAAVQKALGAPVFDERLRARVQEEQIAGMVGIPPEGFMNTRYQQYLASSTWRQKRTLVMQRAQGVCEGCGKAEPDQVHHLTYRRLGDEMLFDLAALCRSCHERIHGI